MAMQWRDDGFRYGAVTRGLHWAMALLLTWQFAGMGVKIIVGKAPITAFWVGTHKGIDRDARRRADPRHHRMRCRRASLWDMGLRRLAISLAYPLCQRCR